jgi:hypothetical protein
MEGRDVSHPCHQEEAKAMLIARPEPAPRNGGLDLVLSIEQQRRDGRVQFSMDIVKLTILPSSLSRLLRLTDLIWSIS